MKVLQKIKSMPTSLKIVGWICFAAIIYFPVFMHLGSLPLVTWDESLFALRALYMYETGEYMINFNQFEGLTSHMNTKLPFTTFFQVLGLKIFGVNELGVRLPIAFLFLGLSYWVFSFFKKYFQFQLVGILFVLLLIINFDFIGDHMLRTGNQDVPFAMYLLLSVLYFWRYTEHKRWKDLLFFCFFTIAALLTKNLLALVILPGLFLFLVINKDRFLTTMKHYKTYVSMVIIASVYVLTIAYFEWQYPGFFQRMWDYELMGRYSQTIEGHGGGFFYYFEYYFMHNSILLSFLILIGLFPLFDKQVDPRIKRLLSLLFLVFISYLLFVSLSATKTTWYTAPLYPIGALITALGAVHFYNTYFVKCRLPVKVLLLGIFFLVCSENYNQVVTRIYKEKPVIREQFYAEYLKNDQGELGKSFFIIDSSFATSVFFTKEKYNRKSDYEILFSKKLDVLKYPAKVLTCSHNEIQYIEKHFNYELINNETKYCRSYLIKGIIEE